MEDIIIREYIANKIREIEGIGQVHERDLIPVTSTDFEVLFGYDGKIQGWNIKWDGIGVLDKRAINFMSYNETYTITTFYGFNSELKSDILFGKHLRQVFKLFAKNPTLGGLVTDMLSIEIPEISLVKIGNVYSHFAKITITVKTFDE